MSVNTNLTNNASNPFLNVKKYVSNSKLALNTYKDIWTRQYNAQTLAQKGERQKTASKWLDQLLEAGDLA